MKKVSSIILSILAVFAIGFTACSSDDNNNDTPNGTEEVVPGNNHKVLIAYFSEPLPDGVDASTSASRLVINDNVVGSVEYLAQLIRQNTGATWYAYRPLLLILAISMTLPTRLTKSVRTMYIQRCQPISRISTTTTWCSWAIPSGDIRCRWRCTRSSTNMISRAKPSFHSRLMAVAVGRVR